MEKAKAIWLLKAFRGLKNKPSKGKQKYCLQGSETGTEDYQMYLPIQKGALKLQHRVWE